MRRALNNKEKATLKAIKDAGHAYEIVEMINWKKEPVYYANANGWCISLLNPGDLKKIL